MLKVMMLEEPEFTLSDFLRCYGKNKSLFLEKTSRRAMGEITLEIPEQIEMLDKPSSSFCSSPRAEICWICPWFRGKLYLWKLCMYFYF